MAQARQFGRIPLEGSVRMEIGGRWLTGTLRNISLRGVSAVLAGLAGCRLQGPCRLTLDPGHEGPLYCQGQVVHAGKERVGVKFTGMDPKSFARLVHLLEHHMERPERVSAELILLARSRAREDGQMELDS